MGVQTRTTPLRVPFPRRKGGDSLFSGAKEHTITECRGKMEIPHKIPPTTSTMSVSPELRFGLVSGLATALRSLVIGIALSTLVIPFAPAIASYGPPELKTFNVASEPEFRNYKKVVTQFAYKHRPRSANDFCILGYTSADGVKSAWVWWHQGRKIILWGGQDSDLDGSQRKINLKTDVVPSGSDLHGSTYLVTKDWVENFTATCNRSGVNVHVSPVANAQPHSSQNGAEK